MCHFSPKLSALDHCATLYPFPPGPLSCTFIVPPLAPLSALLTGVHVARPDLLPVLAAGELGAPEPPLCRHQALLDAPATQLGTVRPTGPRPHFTSWEQTLKVQVH